jgi:hypothetical protein
MKSKIILMLIIINFYFEINSYALNLGEVRYIVHDGGIMVVSSDIKMCWGPGSDPIEVNLLSWPAITPSNVGQTFYTSPEDTYFDIYASMLTSGSNDYFTLHSHLAGDYDGVRWWGPESALINKFIQTDYVDFYGGEINEIGMTVNSLTLVSPGRNPNNDGIWTDYDFDVTFTIIGTFPCQYNLAGDLNDDCKVDMLDFAIVANNWLVDCYTDSNNTACIHK